MQWRKVMSEPNPARIVYALGAVGRVCAPTRFLPNHATETGCLAMQNLASQCQAENEKSPQLRGLRGDFVLFGAGLCRTRDHSHSIVAGGFPEMSYTTRLIPRTSLMIRFDARPSSAYGRCAQCAVMKSVVCTARNDVT